jgi:hypothetical protein
MLSSDPTCGGGMRPCVAKGTGGFMSTTRIACSPFNIGFQKRAMMLSQRRHSPLSHRAIGVPSKLPADRRNTQLGQGSPDIGFAGVKLTIIRIAWPRGP